MLCSSVTAGNLRQFSTKGENSTFFPTGLLRDLEGVWLLMSLPKMGHHEMISTLLEASLMQWWDDALPQGSASASTWECKGAAELLRVAQHGTQRVATRGIFMLQE